MIGPTIVGSGRGRVFEVVLDVLSDGIDCMPSEITGGLEIGIPSELCTPSWVTGGWTDRSMETVFFAASPTESGHQLS